MNVPEEFTYVPSVPPTPVVVKRQAFELRNSLETIDTKNTNFDFRINQRTFVDLKSFYLSFDLHLTLDTLTPKTFANFKSRFNVDGLHIFREIVLRNEAGTVIERLQEVGVLSEIYKNLFASPDHLDTHGELFDSSSNNISRNHGLVTTNGLYDSVELVNEHVSYDHFRTSSLYAWKSTGAGNVYRTYHCPVLKLLGFFQTGKVVRPSTFGGLTIEFILHNDVYQAVQLENIGNKISAQSMVSQATDFSLKNVRLNFDECIVDSAYEQYYNDNYDTRGFRLDIETVDYTSSQVAGNTSLMSQRVIKIPFSVSNARALATVVRPQGVMASKGYRNTTFLPPSLSESWRYQYVNMGGRYPLVPVESFTSNIQEVNKFKRQTQTLTQDTMYTLSNITRPFSIRGGMTNTSTQSVNGNTIPAGVVYPLQIGSGGRFMMFAHLERVLNSRYTGIPLDANSLVLEVKMGNALTDPNFRDIAFKSDLDELEETDITGGDATNHPTTFQSIFNTQYQNNSGYQLDSYVLYTSSVYVMNGQISVTK